MPVVHYFGRVLPLGARLELKNMKSFQLGTPETDGDVWTFQISIDQSIIHVRLDTEHEHGLDEIYWRIMLAAKMVVNLFAFQNGVALDVVLDSFLDYEGKFSSPVQHDIMLQELCTAFDVRNDIMAAMNLVNTKASAIMAMNDLVEGQRNTPLLFVNCARAMEGIRNAVAPDIEDTKEQWAIMRGALRIEEPYLRYISDASKSHRHAVWEDMIGNKRLELLRRSWTIMNRYLHYCARGGEEPLPESEFPPLSTS